jgi:hypothetical protein
MRRLWKRWLLWPIAATVVVAMFGMLLSWVTSATTLGQHYLADPSARVPILPAFAAPRSGGGWLPPPGPPSAAYIQAKLAQGRRQPGDKIVSHKLVSERLGAPRFYPGVGRAREWQLTYRCQIDGPDGPYSFYVDRTALVREP